MFALSLSHVCLSNAALFRHGQLYLMCLSKYSSFIRSLQGVLNFLRKKYFNFKKLCSCLTLSSNSFAEFIVKLPVFYFLFFGPVTSFKKRRPALLHSYIGSIVSGFKLDICFRRVLKYEWSLSILRIVTGPFFIFYLLYLEEKDQGLIFIIDVKALVLW